MLVVTHEMAFARDVSSKVVFLHKGIVEEEGDPAEIFGTQNPSASSSFFRTNGSQSASIEPIEVQTPNLHYVRFQLPPAA